MALNPPLVDWHGKVVWIVGASSGIGRATAERLHDRGATVIVSARQAARLAAFCDRRDRAFALPLDVSDHGALRDAVATIVERHGGLDLALYSAGHYKALRATAFDLDEMLRHERINYVGALHWLDALLPVLLPQARNGRPAHLSLVASVAGYRGLPNGLAYGPTKAALINLAETLYLDLQDHGVAVSLINPGFVETPLTAQNEFTMPALISPDAAADAIVHGWASGEFELHFPKRFTRVLKLLSHFSARPYFAAVRRATGL